MITRADLDKAFNEQRQMTTHAIEGPGLESYLRNLGFDYEDMLAWTYEYVLGNVTDNGRAWDEDDINFATALLSRAIVVGLIIGRDSEP